MKLQAAGIPRQADKGQYPARLGLGVGHHVFVGQVQNRAGGQHLVPMAHQRHVTRVIAPQRALVVGKLHGVVEQARVARKARIHRVPHGVDDFGVRQRQVNQAQVKEIGRHLVGDEGALGRELPNPLQIVVAQPLQVKLRQRGNTGGERLARTRTGGLCDSLVQFNKLAAAVHRRVAAQNLLQ